MRNPLAVFGKRSRASRANERARKLERLERSTEAADEYLRACRIDPEWSVPEYNLGLIYKYAGDWARSMEHNLRATRLAPDDQAGWWNLGIAATALGRWDVARFAWRGAGIEVPEGGGPLDYPCGRAPIRLNPNADAEVVWSERLDPARAKVQSIPLPDSGFRFGDVVLNDGASTGWRKLNDQEVPVFNCLALLQPSRFSTWVAVVDLPDTGSAVAGAVDLLGGLALERDLAAEDWSTSIQILCKACSEGKPYSDHEHPKVEPGRHRRVAIAAQNADQAKLLLEDWRSQAGDITVLEFDLALDAAV
jgi:tetratricopeptide (TPR) repeat protein